MTNEDKQIIVSCLTDIENRLTRIEEQLFNKLKIARVIDVSNDKVHMAKKIVNIWETPDGVLVYIE